MFPDAQYSLLDFGQGRKLERFGAYILDRPAPAAEGVNRAEPELWSQAHARYERGSGDRGKWKKLATLPPTWTISHDVATFELAPNEFGHVGVFVEQAENWDWIARQVHRAQRPLRVLNLFAHTGGSTLAAALAGAAVTHVDAAKNVVARARRNAELSGLASAPIRWIVEDAPTFVARELRRGNQYDAVILDPPSYGHGRAGEVWKLADGLLPLLADCRELTAQQRAFLLLTCHSPSYGPAELQACLADAVFGHCQSGVEAKSLAISTSDGRRLPCGVAARCPG